MERNHDTTRGYVSTRSVASQDALYQNTQFQFTYQQPPLILTGMESANDAIDTMNGLVWTAKTHYALTHSSH